MEKPVPRTETKQIMDLIQMQRWIDHKYGIKARDYKNKFGFNHKTGYLQAGLSEERAEYIYTTLPADLVITDAERAIREQVQADYERWNAEHPYCDFWHFQLELFDNFSNDSYQTLNLIVQLEAAKEDWQKEIAQMWLDEYGEFMDEEGDIELWVCW